MPTGLPGDPQDDGFIRPSRGGGGTPGTGFGSGGGFGGAPSGGAGGGGFSGYSAYSGQPGGSWARKLRYGQPAPSAPSGLSTSPTTPGGPFLPNAPVGGNYVGYNPFPGMGALPGSGGSGGGGGGGWWGDWASGPDTQPGNSSPEMGDIARWLVANGGQAGIFDPMGSQGLLQMMQQKAYSEAGAREDGAANAAGMAFGDDPQMAAFARLQARLGGQRDLATSLSGARQASALQNQQYLQQLASAMYQQWAQYMAQRTGAKLAK